MVPNIIIEKISEDRGTRKDAGKCYRTQVNTRGKYGYRVLYKHTDLLIVSDQDLFESLAEPVLQFYEIVEETIHQELAFETTLAPLRCKGPVHPLIKKMCLAADLFGVGPMASVAGALCEHMAQALGSDCSSLVIENGGDVYIQDQKDVRISLFLENKHFDDLVLEIDRHSIPAGICSSSGKIGHSFSLGKSDLVMVTSRSATTADAAATAIANTIRNKEDIQGSIDHYKMFRAIDAIVAIKDDVVGLWGKIRIARSY